VHGAAGYLITALIGVALIVLIIIRQIGERTWTTRRLVVFPLIFVVAAILNGTTMGHDLASALGVTAFAVGLVLAAALGVARAHTMGVRRGSGNTIVTKGNGWTMMWWGISIAVRVGMAVGLGFLGIREGVGEAMLFAAVTIGIQNAWLAYRGGLLRTAPQAA
jgi:uncharacterized membrane-anchored protein